MTRFLVPSGYSDETIRKIQEALDRSLDSLRESLKDKGVEDPNPVIWRDVVSKEEEKEH